MSPIVRFQWLLPLLDWVALPSLLAMPENRGRLTSRERTFPRHCGVLARHGDHASSDLSFAAAIAGITGNSAIAGNSGASGQPAADEDVSVLDPDDDWPADF